MLKRILAWRWLLPSFGAIILFGILVDAWLSGRSEFNATLLAVLVMCVALALLAVVRRYRPDVFNAYFSSWINTPTRQNPDLVSALEQLTVAVEQCDNGHTPKPIHDAAARARNVLNQLGHSA